MSTIDTQPAKVDTRPRISTILWGINVMLVGGIALAIIANASIDASWALIAIVGLAGVGLLALALSGMRTPRPSSDTATPSPTAPTSGEGAQIRGKSTRQTTETSDLDTLGED